MACQKRCHKKDRKLQRIESKERTEKLQSAAQRRNDLQIICRISNEDVLAKSAGYHDSCFSSYLSETNIQGKKKVKTKFL